jgi:hypothetical protein
MYRTNQFTANCYGGHELLYSRSKYEKFLPFRLFIFEYPPRMVSFAGRPDRPNCNSDATCDWDHADEKLFQPFPPRLRRGLCTLNHDMRLRQLVN